MATCKHPGYFAFTIPRKAFDAFCEKFHIPEEVHPALPNRGDTIHERPAGKIGLYTRAAKVSRFEILCRVYEIIPTVGLFCYFYVNSKKNGWISFSKQSDNVPVCYMKPLDSVKIGTITFSRSIALLALHFFMAYCQKRD
nr:hypothetical protein [Tanacetum cinerariifolium]